MHENQISVTLYLQENLQSLQKNHLFPLGPDQAYTVIQKQSPLDSGVGKYESCKSLSMSGRQSIIREEWTRPDCFG